MDYSKNYGDITAQRLRELRERKGYSHSVLADKFNRMYENLSYTDKDGQKRSISLSESALKSFEVGDKPHSKRLAGDGMGIRYLRCLADFYDVSADYLLGLSDFETQDIELAIFQERFGLSDYACEALENFADLASEYDGDIFKQTDFVNELILSCYYPAMLFCDAIDSYLRCKLADVTMQRYGIAEDGENVVISAHEYALLSKERAKSLLSEFVEDLWNELCKKHGTRPDLTYNYDTHRKMIIERFREISKEVDDDGIDET
ncbi:MAG: hypothetical protein IJY96_06000 [Oscillospiraceae bacterium]|nr:hypothetical protein [Oscillospiraceae bacterium]